MNVITGLQRLGVVLTWLLVAIVVIFWLVFVPVDEVPPSFSVMLAILGGVVSYLVGMGITKTLIWIIKGFMGIRD